MNIIAHLTESGIEHALVDHLKNTAERAARFAEPFGGSSHALRMGYLHDIGKIQNRFQRRIRGENVTCEHSTPGAIEANRLNDAVSAFCIAGHHGGIPDIGTVKDTHQEATLHGRLKRKDKNYFEDYSEWESLIAVPSYILPEWLDAMKDLREKSWSNAFYTRMLFSCLVDADYLDTEYFMSSGNVQRGKYDPISVLNERLDSYIDQHFSVPRHDLDRMRNEIRNECDQKAKLPPSIYSLTVPTGGGKTIVSLSFALKHAIEHRMERVIFVVPYTSIIEQTADVFRKILGEEAVIEHHSNVTYKDKGDTSQEKQIEWESQSNDKCTQRKKWAIENWDAPIIITTAVQFFESLYSNRPSQCRKLHNIANSVLIFDEAQMIPVPYLYPCIGAITELVKHYRATAVLCTATQPNLDDFVRHFLPNQQIIELCEKQEERYEFFRRVRYEYKEEPYRFETLAQELRACHQVLCIVNTRKRAQELHQLLPAGTYHLSTLMTPFDRKVILKRIRQDLRDGKECRVVSTSLIEAGVDVDFPTVYREAAGLDSIIQSGGRCNREGRKERDDSIVRIFSFEGVQVPPLFLQNYSAMKEAIRTAGSMDSLNTIREYYRFLYYVKGFGSSNKSNGGEEIAFDCKESVDRIRKLRFRSVAHDFKLIEDNTRTIYIDRKDEAGNFMASGLLARIKDGYANREDYREAGQFAVSVYEREFEALREMGVLDVIEENQSGILWGEAQYDPTFGIQLEERSVSLYAV